MTLPKLSSFQEQWNASIFLHWESLSFWRKLDFTIALNEKLTASHVRAPRKLCKGGCIIINRSDKSTEQHAKKVSISGLQPFQRELSGCRPFQNTTLQKLPGSNI